jgi:hypothetical protein
MAALEASLAAVKGDGEKPAPKKKAAAKKPAQRKRSKAKA